MITTTVTLDEVSRRCGVPVDVRVFRPNIVLAPDEGEEVGVFEEDYWAQVQVQEEVALEITANCARCSSINVGLVRTSVGVEADECVR